MARTSTMRNMRTMGTMGTMGTMRSISNKSKSSNSNMITMVVVIVFLLLAIFIMYYFNKTIMEKFSENSNYVLEYYYMDECGHCISFNESGVWDQLKNQYGNSITFKKYNNNEERAKIEKYKITGFPTIIVTKNDEKIKEYKGDRSKEDLEKFIVSYIEKVNS